MAQTKATRKFEKNRLKDVLKRRKEGAKVKQKKHIREKLKVRRKQDRQNGDHTKEQDPNATAGKDKNRAAEAFADMSVDEFFQGGFEIPAEMDRNSQSKRGNTRSSEQSKEPITGKRKRRHIDKEEHVDQDMSSDASSNPSETPQRPDSDSEADEDPHTHKQQLEALAEKDPEFHKYLQENDAELLDFDEEAAALEDLEGLSDESDAGDAPSKKSKKSRRGEEDKDAGNEVSAALVKKWQTALTAQHSLRAMREVVLAFRAAAHVNEDGKEFKYSISSPDIYHELLIVSLTKIPDVLQHHLPVKESGSGKIRIATESKKYRTLTPILKSHAISVTHLLDNLSDAGTQKITLHSITALLPYLLAFKKLLRDLVRSIVAVWSDNANNEATRVAAFLALRRLAVIGDPGIRESVLRTTYQGLIRGSRQTTAHTLPGINLMKNSAAELWGLDASVSYSTGFTFIRQLAIHLRTSITGGSSSSGGVGKGKEAYKTVYNWQYVHSLDFWSRVLAAHCSTYTLPSGSAKGKGHQQQPLHPLIYPTVQVTLGAARLIPTPQYFPLRFQLVRALLRISLATDTYIPLASLLLEVLSSAELRRAPKPTPSTLKPLDFATAVRAPKAYLKSRVYQDGVAAQVVELLGEFFALNAKSIAFPELALPVIVAIKRWLKEVSGGSPHTSRGTLNRKGTPRGKSGAGGNRNGKANAAVNVLVQKLQAHSAWIEERRAKVEFAPDSREGVEGFLRDVEWETTPLGAYIVSQRKMREEQAKLVEEGRREDERRRTEEKEGVGDADGGDGSDEVDQSDEEMDDFADEDIGSDVEE